MSFTTVVQLLLTCQLTNQDWTICVGTKNYGLRIRWAQKLLYSHWSQALPNTQIIVLLVGKKVKLNMLLLVLTKARNGCNLRLLSLSAISFYRNTKISHITEVVHILQLQISCSQCLEPVSPFSPLTTKFSLEFMNTYQQFLLSIYCWKLKENTQQQHRIDKRVPCVCFSIH